MRALLALAVAIALVAPWPARSDEAPAPPVAPAGSTSTARNWDLMVFGYGWLSSLRANLEVGPATVEIDESIVDLVPKLTWALAGGAEGRYEDFVVGFDALGQQIQMTERAPGASFALDPLGGPFGGLTATRGPSSASIRSTEVMAEAMAGWRALSVPISKLFAVPANDPRAVWLDLFAGARYWYWRTEVRLSIPPVTVNAANPPAFPSGLRGRIAERILSRLDLPESVQVGGSQAVLEDVESWTDGIVGFRIGGDLTETVSLSYRTDIGGFGWGDSSDFTWQVMTGVQWRFTENWVAALDWRILGFDRAKVENAFFYGALLGVGYRF